MHGMVQVCKAFEYWLHAYAVSAEAARCMTSEKLPYYNTSPLNKGTERQGGTHRKRAGKSRSATLLGIITRDAGGERPLSLTVYIKQVIQVRRHRPHTEGVSSIADERDHRVYKGVVGFRKGRDGLSQVGGSLDQGLGMEEVRKVLEEAVSVVEQPNF